MLLGESFTDNENNTWAFEMTRQVLCCWGEDLKLTPKAGFVFQSLPPLRTVKVNDLCYALSNTSYQIIQCDCLQKKVDFIGKEENVPYLWSNFFADTNGIWFVPQGVDGNLEYFDLEKHVFKRDYRFSGQLLKYCTDKSLLTAFTCNWAKDVIGAVYGTGYIYRYHTDTQKFDISNVGDRRICSVIFDGRFYWMTQLGNNNILRWDQSNQIVKEIHIQGDPCERPYGRLFIKDDYVVILPCWGQKLIVINKESMKVICFRIPEVYMEKRRDDLISLIFIGSIVGKKIVLSSWFDTDILLVLDLNDMSLNTQKVIWKEQSFFMESYLKNVDSIVHEEMDCWCTLDNYCRALININECKDLKNRSFFNEMGSKIYNSLL